MTSGSIALKVSFVQSRRMSQGWYKSDLTRDEDHASTQDRPDRIKRRADLVDAPGE